MDDRLRQVLEQALAEGRTSNAALDAVMADYARYHAVLAVVGGLATAALVVVAVLSLLRARRALSRDGRRWTVERTALLLIGLGSALMAALLGVVVAANIGTALRPQRGFEGAVTSLSAAAPGSHRDQVQSAYAAWLRSGSAQLPDDVADAVRGRLDWQAPKAAITTLLLVLACAAAATLLRRIRSSSRAPGGPGRGRAWGALAGLGAASMVCVLLLLMVLGNSQAALAPVAITMFYG
jgi:hypothetical protein